MFGFKIDIPYHSEMDDSMKTIQNVNRIKAINFYKELSGRWYVDLPDYPGPKGDLQMVAGADKMLDVIAKDASECTLLASDEEFQGAEVLRLVTGYNEQHGDYLLEEYHGEKINHKMWLCPVISYVFGRLPQVIYFKD